ncbi:unnamed protein product [Somion occarium]|uniref:Uncharacterized protein n=1 Tax=Somion occarium TaxID=3059160 RepID=A0ABP1CKR4_9APHY
MQITPRNPVGRFKCEKDVILTLLLKHDVTQSAPILIIRAFALCPDAYTQIVSRRIPGEHRVYNNYTSGRESLRDRTHA